MDESRSPYPLLHRQRRRPRGRRLPRWLTARLVALAVVIGVVFAVAAATATRVLRPSPEATLARAEAALAAGDLSGAARLARPAAQAMPASVPAQVMLARVELALGQGVAAEAALDRAEAAGLPPSRQHAWRAEALLLEGDADGAADEAAHDPTIEGRRIAARVKASTGDMAGAERLLTAVTAASPRDAAALTDLGRVRLTAGDIGGAALAAARAVAVDPRQPVALTLEGEVVRSRNGPLASLPWFAAALQRDPAYHPALIERAATLADLGRATEALADVRAALAARPGSPQAYLIAAAIAARAGRFDLADALLGRAGPIDATPSALLLRGAIDDASGRFGQAAAAWGRLVAAQPLNLVARRLLGAALLRSGNPTAALDALRPLALRSDADAYTLRLAAAALAETGDRGDALVLIDRAQRTGRAPAQVFASSDDVATLAQGEQGSPTDPTYAVGLIRGLLGARQGGAALARAQALASAAPGAPAAQLALGDVLAVQGRAADARRAFTRAADLEFDEPVMLRLIDADARANDPTAAAAALSLYLGQNPASVAGRRLLGHWQLAAGRADDAVETLETLRRAVGLRDVALLVDLARAYAGVGEPEVARRYAARAYALAPMNAGAVAAYRDALAAAGDRDGAAQLATKLGQLGG